MTLGQWGQCCTFTNLAMNYKWYDFDSHIVTVKVSTHFCSLKKIKMSDYKERYFLKNTWVYHSNFKNGTVFYPLSIFTVKKEFVFKFVLS